MMQPVIFDFNGTMLLDSDKNEAAWCQMIKEAVGYELTARDFAEHVHGIPNPETIKYYINKKFTLAETQPYSQRKEEIYRRLCLEDKEHFCLTKGLPEYLDYLVEKNIPHIIATSADWGNVSFYIKHFQLGRWFDPEKIIYFDGSFPGKPDPAIYLLAAQRLEVDIHTCLVYEDAYQGVIAAQRAGVKRIIGLAAVPASQFLYKMPEVDTVIENFTVWRNFV